MTVVDGAPESLGDDLSASTDVRRLDPPEEVRRGLRTTVAAAGGVWLPTFVSLARDVFSGDPLNMNAGSIALTVLVSGGLLLGKRWARNLTVAFLLLGCVAGVAALLLTDPSAGTVAITLTTAALWAWIAKTLISSPDVNAYLDYKSGPQTLTSIAARASELERD